MMLDQIIYTRCSPHRDLKNKGRVVRSDGFGVFSMSQELLTGELLSNYDFLQARLATPNGAKESAPIGLFHSYEYSMVAPGVYTLSYEVARPQCKIPRANGKGHRAGTYIKQAVVGEIQGYPAEWFGSSNWNAHQKSENDYYLDNAPDAEPDFLPQVSSTPTGGYISTAIVKDFVSDGRADAVKAGIWFLLQEFAKPEAERKVLLIKDTPDRVELWIAAIEYGFSASMAQKITFTTNRSNLARGDSVLFYYTDDAGRYQPMVDHSIPQTRHPYCMIVGYHPKDNFCSALRQMPASNFVIIDGTTKTISFQPDGTIRMPYYSAVVQYDADIQDFCHVVLPSITSCELSGNLPELFDAYKYLLDSNHRSSKWGYSDAVRYFGVLLQHGIPDNPALNNYLVDECLAVYPHFAVEDEQKGCPLLKHMWKLAKPVGREKDITGCVADIVSDQLNKLSDRSNGIADTWQAFNASGITAIIQPALPDLFNDTELPYYAKQFKNSDAASVKTVLDMYFFMLTVTEGGLASISKTDERYSFVCVAMIRLLHDQNRLMGVLKKLNTSPDLLHDIALSVALYLEEYEPTKTAAWWDMVMDASGCGVLELCRRLCASRSATIEMVEKLLASRINRVRKFEPDIGRAFIEAMSQLGKSPDTGRQLFYAWVKFSQPNDVATIIHTIKKCALNPKVEAEIFKRIDSELPYDVTRSVHPTVYRDMRQWAASINMVSRSAAFYEFKRSFVAVRYVEEAINLAHSFADMEFTVNKQVLESNYFSEIFSVSAGFCNPSLHIALLCLFRGINDATIDYVDAYVAEVLAVTRGRNMVPQLLSLCKATMAKFKVPGRTTAFVDEVQKLLDTSLAKQLVKYYRPALVDQVSKYGDSDQNVRKRLLLMLKEAGENAAPRGLSGLLGNLFGRR